MRQRRYEVTEPTTADVESALTYLFVFNKRQSDPSQSSQDIIRAKIANEWRDVSGRERARLFAQGITEYARGERLLEYFELVGSERSVYHHECTDHCRSLGAIGDIVIRRSGAIGRYEAYRAYGLKPR